MFRKTIDQAAGVAEKIKTEIGKAGEVVTAALVLAAVALVVAVAALFIGLKPRACHASR